MIHMRDMTHSRMWHDPSMCDMTQDSCIRVNCSLMRVTWLLHACDMTSSCVWHDSFMHVTWPTHMFYMTHDSCIRVNDSFMRVTWLLHVCDMTHSCVCHDAFMCVTRLMTWGLAYTRWIHSTSFQNAWHDSFVHTCNGSVRVTRRIHALMRYDSFMCATWLVHIFT